MGIAMFVLGERVSCELSDGSLHYSLVAAKDGVNQAVALSKDCLPALGLHSGESIDSVLGALKQLVTLLLQMLEIELSSVWPVCLTAEG